MLVSDALSRVYMKNSKPEFDENSLIDHVHFVISNLPISNKRLEQFKEKTRTDPILQNLIKVERWPEKSLILKEKNYTRIFPIVVTYLTMKDYFSKISDLLSPVL